MNHYVFPTSQKNLLELLLIYLGVFSDHYFIRW